MLKVVKNVIDLHLARPHCHDISSRIFYVQPDVFSSHELKLNMATV